MKFDVVNTENKKAGDVELNDDIFSVEARSDILHRVVQYQLAKRRSGTSKVKGRSEVKMTGAKFVRQKGSGGARHSSRSVSQFVGGGSAFGPKPRSYEFSLPKKVRALGLKMAISSKVSDGSLIVVDNLAVDTSKTKDVVNVLNNLNVKSGLIVDIFENDKLRLACANVKNIDTIPVEGLNVYDILRKTNLVVSKDAITKIEERLKWVGNT